VFAVSVVMIFWSMAISVMSPYLMLTASRDLILPNASIGSKGLRENRG
jgi:hypothetical protein